MKICRTLHEVFAACSELDEIDMAIQIHMNESSRTLRDWFIWGRYLEKHGCGQNEFQFSATSRRKGGIGMVLLAIFPLIIGGMLVVILWGMSAAGENAGLPRGK
jgi:hypothetical protein